MKKLIKTTAFIVVLITLALCEPVLRSQLIFAVPPVLNNGEVIYENKLPLDKYTPIDTSVLVTPKPQRAHAPEPSTLLLMLGGIWAMIVRFAQRSFAKFKRALDLFLSVLGLFIILPVLLICAVLIKLTSKGPIVYKQNRVGLGGKVFQIYKLRTMRVDAEKFSGAVWATENDPRVTPIGKFLRRAHLDEIPQVLNVFKGEMSIVGPRPERPEMVRDLKTLIVDYEKRLHVQPGITGLAQVSHKYDETIDDVRKKVKYDLLYIKKMCWRFEMRILAQTFVVALTGKGAH